MVIYLNKKYAVPWNLDEYYKKYGVEDKYQLLKGAPLLVNVEGTYVELDSLVQAAKPKDAVWVNAFIQGVRHPVPKGIPSLMPYLTLR